MANPFQRLLDLAPRSQVQLKRLVKLESVTVDSVEIFIKDVNLSRDAMWNFSASMIGNCVYIDQRLLYLGSRVGVTKHIYKNGKNVTSGYVDKNTKIIYRSESAKLLCLSNYQGKCGILKKMEKSCFTN